MRTKELSELILKILYDNASVEGFTNFFNIIEIAEKIGEVDKAKIRNATKLLENRGLVYPNYQVYGNIDAQITEEGVLFIEEDRETVIEKFNNSPNPININIDQSTNIEGVSNSNISVHSKEVTQTIDTQINQLFSQIKEELKKDQLLSENEKENLIRDAELLKKLISKNQKDEDSIKNYLSKLGNVASIASFVGQLAPLIFA